MYKTTRRQIPEVRNLAIKRISSCYKIGMLVLCSSLSVILQKFTSFAFVLPRFT